MSFQVIPASVPVSREDWTRAMTAPASELPELTSAQREEMARLRVNEEDFRRVRILLRSQVKERQTQQGRRFGSVVEEMLQPLGQQYRVTAVSRVGTPLGWRVAVDTESEGVYEFQSPFEVVDALIEGRATEAQRQSFREQLWSELVGSNRREVAK